VKQKLPGVAVLRCLGATEAQTFAIYLAQSMALGACGALAGALAGVAVQVGLPRVLADFLPMKVEFDIAWGAVAESMFAGFGLCVLFALLPLLAVRGISPLAAIRLALQPPAKRDPARWVALALLAAGIGAFLIRHTERLRDALGFGVGLLAAFLVLAGAAKLLVWLTRRWLGPALPYLWRQGLANLHRPGNRTLLLLTSLGLGTFLITTLVLTQQTLLTQLVPNRDGTQANAVLFDIQDDQREGVAALLMEQGLPVLDQAPVVTMRLLSVAGWSVEDRLATKSNSIPNWVLRREFRSTYRNDLRDAEKLVAGQWPSSSSVEGEVIPISLETGIAKDLGVKLGDSLVWDVQGVPMTTRVAALREVDWRRVQPNFFAVFPPVALEGAPAFHIMTTRVNSAAESAALQRAVAQRFPTVSSIDVTLILQTIDSVLGKVAFVIRFMAGFTVATGLLVLAGAILTGRFQRIQESTLLRTLGATRSQVRKILLVEYAALGALAALTGVLLAVSAAWALSYFVFQTPFAPSVLLIATAVTTVTLLTVGIGWLGSRGVLNAPPLEVLRGEG
jgi:putative ABC transport system permease protein